MAVALTVGIPPSAVPEGGGWPLSGLLSVLRQVPALADVTGVPVQAEGGAPDGGHYVPAEQTRADGGAGKKPGRGVGAVDAEIAEPDPPKAWIAPAPTP